MLHFDFHCFKYKRRFKWSVTSPRCKTLVQTPRSWASQYLPAQSSWPSASFFTYSFFFDFLEQPSLSLPDYILALPEGGIVLLSTSAYSCPHWYLSAYYECVSLHPGHRLCFTFNITWQRSQEVIYTCLWLRIMTWAWRQNVMMTMMM